MSSKNKFNALFDARRGEDVPEESPPAKPVKGSQKGKAKRSDAEYTQVSAYIRKTTYRDVKIALLKEGETQFSELVETLLTQWLKSRT